MNNDTIKREDALNALLRMDGTKIDKALAMGEIRSIPSADRPSGEVDAVKEYECQVHNLNQGYITLGEFDKRVEPLRHLYYDRPQGEWIVLGGTDFSGISYCAKCSNCKTVYDGIRLSNYSYCPNCGCRMKGADDERN